MTAKQRERYLKSVERMHENVNKLIDPLMSQLENGRRLSREDDNILGELCRVEAALATARWNLGSDR